MKRLSFLLCVAVISIGCSSGGDEGGVSSLPAGAGKISNPSGKPQTAEQAQMMEQMKLAGDGISRQMQEAARAEKEAKQRTGGK